jgi:hypothetical protein
MAEVTLVIGETAACSDGSDGKLLPPGQITGFEDGIRLSITRQQGRELPPVAAGQA